MSIDLSINSIQTFSIMYHKNVHNNHLHRGDIPSPWATSHQPTPYHNSCHTCALTRPPPFLLESSLVPRPIKQTTETLYISSLNTYWCSVIALIKIDKVVRAPISLTPLPNKNFYWRIRLAKDQEVYIEGREEEGALTNLKIGGEGNAFHKWEIWSVSDRLGK